MPARQFPSRKQTICIRCNKSIEIGQQIGWNPRIKGQAWHFDCNNIDTNRWTIEQMKEKYPYLDVSGIKSESSEPKESKLSSNIVSLDDPRLNELRNISSQLDGEFCDECMVRLPNHSLDCSQHPINKSNIEDEEEIDPSTICQECKAEKDIRDNRIYHSKGCSLYSKLGICYKCMSYLPDHTIHCADNPLNQMNQKTREKKEITKKVEPTKMTNTQDNLAATLAQALMPQLMPNIQEIMSQVSSIENKVDEKQVNQLINAAMIEAVGDTGIITTIIKNCISNIRTPLSIRILSNDPEGNEVKRNFDNCHFQVDKLLKLVQAREDIYLFGEPGSGKSFAAHQIAEMLGLEYGYISLELQTPASRLVGYMDANGNYVSTIFRKLYENGGVFCIDEMDNASGNLLTSLNSALGNGSGAFPNGMVKRHKDFICISTGNTAGLGGNVRFPERRVLDSAFRDRFIFINWQYDEILEENITLAINPDAINWLLWVRSVREYVVDNSIRLIATPRASFKGAKRLLEGFGIDEIADMTLFKGIDKDTKQRILNNIPLPVVKVKSNAA